MNNVLCIDNFDSFVYNLSRYVTELGFKTIVKRNNAISLHDIEILKPTHIIISPGPCTPDQAGISLDIIRKFYDKIPILGVCLGHQAIGQVFGSCIIRAKNPMHGKASLIQHNGEGIFKDLPNPLKVGRYHSLIVAEENLKDLIITARCERNEVMGLQHQVYPIFGVQFHPESILTEKGHQLLFNFLKI